MKKKNIFIGVLVVLNLMLLLVVFQSQSGETFLGERAYGDGQESSEIDYEEAYNKLNKRVEELESKVDNIHVRELKENLMAANGSIKRLEDILFSLDNVTIKHGVIIDSKEDNTLSLTVRPYEFLQGQEAIETIIDKWDMSKEEATEYIEKEGHAFVDLDLDEITLKIPNNCKVYMVSEKGLVEANLTDLKELSKMETELEDKHEYSFILVEGKVVQFY
ncbi:hypothetical protein [Dethiothermospora halolimnae]|uniref:hypothetical protein n=1 Tax=Dethiothermospora halolimnae TaxID=3114390 RepID=UPI003CCBF5FB